MRVTLGFMLAVAAAALGAPMDPDAAEFVARYAFEEGTGEVLHDGSGNGHDGRIVGAVWEMRDGRAVLRFDGSGDYVDFGDNRALKPTGDFTMLAWVYLDASPYPDGNTNWTIIDCEAYREEGFVVRVDGAAAKVMFRASQRGKEQCGFGKVVLENRRAYLVGVVQQSDQATVYVDGRPDVQFAVQTPNYGAVPFKLSSTDQSFQGTIGEVALFDRALGNDEIAGWYWREAERYGKDVAQRGGLRIHPFVYHDDREAIAEVDFFGILPLAEGEKASVELARRGGASILSQDVRALPEWGAADYEFKLEDLDAGEYELRAVVKGPGRNVAASAPFTYPAPPIGVPSPEVRVVEPLPMPPPRPPCDVEVCEGGGFIVKAGERSFPVTSNFSFPHGSENRLTCAASDEQENERTWQANWTTLAGSQWELKASGASYAIRRKVRATDGSVRVRDTITNTTQKPVGIIFGNRLSAGKERFETAFLAGQETRTTVSGLDVKTCPTAFMSAPGCGVGLVALDDVYIVQSRGSFDGESITLSSREFALDAGASYSLEWEIQANETGDYYDFINAARPAPVTVEGALALVPGTQRKRDVRLVPDAEYFEMRNAAFATLYCLSWCTDDRTISLEGIEFVEYPEERRRIREMMERMKEVVPDVKGMFHVAHQLYATGRPDEYFADSQVIDADGNHAVYPYDYANGSYFSKERYEDNWRWWIYYPTLDNSFGKAMLDSVDVMMDEMGCRGVFVDGFLWGYGGEYTYDRWDGHSADIDRETKTITRKKGSTLLLTQEAMVAYCRKVWSKGGVVIANNVVPTRTISSLPLIMDKEITEGPYVHLATTPIVLGNPAAIQSEVDVYKDVLSKLRWGNLYFYYGEPDQLTYESLPSQMYPITAREVHEGYVKGDERLVTMRSGVYGWSAPRDLHLAYRYDARGRSMRPGFLTTVDAISVRTQVELNENESAVLVRVPVTIAEGFPVNVVVERFDEEELSMTVNAPGAIKILTCGLTPHEFELNGAQRVIRIPHPLRGRKTNG